MASVFNTVDELRSGKETWRIKVQIIRIWYSQGFTNSKLPHSLEMVLMDEDGSKIHATVKKTLMYKFEKALVDGSVYSLAGFCLVESSGDYRTTNHKYKISFMFKTELLPLNPFPHEVFPFTFASLEEIMAPSFDCDYLVDVIGIMTGVGVEREIVTHGRRSKMNVIEIASEGRRLECALFGNYADELTIFLARGEVYNPVVIVQFAKVKTFQGNKSLQNVHGATKIMYDPDVPMAGVLKSRHEEKSQSASWALSQLLDSKNGAGEDDFLVLTSMKNLAELKLMKKDGYCIVLATMCPFEESGDWWYTTCKCNKKVYADEKMYFCEGCNRHVVNVFPRFRLQLRVEDEFESAIFVLFDKEATILVGKTCSELVDEFVKDDENDGIPVEISKLFGSVALFKVEVKNYSNQRFDRSRFEPLYRVKKVCTDENIIQQFQKMQLENSVGVASSSMLPSPKKKFDTEAVTKDLLEDFVVVSGEKSPETPLSVAPLSLGYPAVDLDGPTQEVFNSKRSSSPESQDLEAVVEKKKRAGCKTRK